MQLCLLCNQPFTDEVDLKTIFLPVSYVAKIICVNCYKKFKKITHPACINCNSYKNKLNQEQLCNDCLAWKVRYNGDLVFNRSIYQYNDAFHDLMVAYKRYGHYVLFNVLAELIKNQLPLADRYIPIPSSPEHLQQRGYDTIISIYEPLCNLSPVLIKKAGGEAQGEKNKNERLATDNLFSLKANVKLSGQIVLRDDIYTTGRTIYHAWEIIKKAFPDCNVSSFTIAR